MRAIPVGVVTLLVLFVAQPTSKADDAKRARLIDNTVFVQIRLKETDPFSGKSGCTSSSQKGQPLADATLKCGYPSAVSEVTWKYIKTVDAGDVYRFTRRFPSDVENPKEETKEVTYTGKEIVVFQDKFHRIGMAPKHREAKE